MDYLDQALNHINVSINNLIDRQTFIGCIKDKIDDPQWKYHVITFFLETEIGVIHKIVLEKTFTFEEIYNAYLKWDTEGIAWNETTDWIMEMCYLSTGRAHELDPKRFH